MNAHGESSFDEGDPRRLVGQTIADRYRLEAFLGEGAMGAVYRATHLGLKKRVALKVLHPVYATAPEIAERFEREAVLAGRVDHDGVAKATDFGRAEDGRAFLVMEFVDGKNLAAVLAGERLSLERVASIGLGLARALAAIHEAGIVHRDLKPGNVMLASAGGDRVKVLDLGMARVELQSSSPLTRAGTILGTPEYMAPEQAAGQAAGPGADYYALGVMLHEMIAGQRPFHGDSPVDVLCQHLTAAPPELPLGTPLAWGELVGGLLEKEPARRPDGAAVRRRLAALADGVWAEEWSTETTGAAWVTQGPREALAEERSRRRSGRPSLGVAARAGLVVLAAAAGMALLFGRGLLRGPALAAAPAAVEVAAARRAQPVPSAMPFAIATAHAEPATPAPLATVAAPPASASAPSRTAKAGAPQRGKGAKAVARAPSRNAAKGTPRPVAKRRTGPFGIYVAPVREWF